MLASSHAKRRMYVGRGGGRSEPLQGYSKREILEGGSIGGGEGSKPLCGGCRSLTEGGGVGGRG